VAHGGGGGYGGALGGRGWGMGVGAVGYWNSLLYVNIYIYIPGIYIYVCTCKYTHTYAKSENLVFQLRRDNLTKILRQIRGDCGL
jgi:hypothetical protein